MKRLALILGLLLLAPSAFATTYSISGNAGVAGAYVSLVSYANNVALSTTADGSGNYTFSSLAAGQYYVTANLIGYTFSPTTLPETIVSSNITGANFTATSFPTPSPGLWVKNGTTSIIASTNNDGVQPGNTVLYEGNCQVVVATNCFKSWYMDGTNVFYAESTDGLNWSKYSGNPIVSGKMWPTVFEYSGTYYLYCGSELGTSTSLYTATDGVTFSLVSSSVLTTGAGGAWDSGNLFQLFVVEVVGGVWHAIYTASAEAATDTILGLGYATSTDGMTWTKYASNPVLVDGSAAFITKIGSIYYAWFNYVNYVNGEGGPAPYTLPSDVYRMQSTDLIHWTNLQPSLPRTLTFEGAGTNESQTGMGSLIQVGAFTYMFYMGTTNGTNGTNSNMIYSRAVAPIPIASVVASNEGVYNGSQMMQQAISYGFTTVEASLSDGGNFVASHSQTVPTVPSVGTCQPSATGTFNGTLWTGAIAAPSNTWPNDQYVELKIKTISSVYDLWPWIRYSTSAPSGYQALFSNSTPTTVYIDKVVAGSGIVLGSQTATPAVGDTWRFSALGTTLSLSQNGTTIMSLTDSTYSSGVIGFQIYNDTAAADTQISNFAGGALQTATPLYTPVGGAYSSAQTVTIGSGTTGATIYYTTDGTTPSHSSSSISNGGTITVSSSETVKTLASTTDNLDSPIGSASYAIGAAANAGLANGAKLSNGTLTQ